MNEKKAQVAGPGAYDRGYELAKSILEQEGWATNEFLAGLRSGMGSILWGRTDQLAKDIVWQLNLDVGDIGREIPKPLKDLLEVIDKNPIIEEQYADLIHLIRSLIEGGMLCIRTDRR